jgi:hypothetical protein
VMQSLFAAAGSPKDMWVVPGAAHGDYWATAPSSFESRVAAFLDSALMEASTSVPGSAKGSP